jgi:predicted AAA+ superfamily ATPase
VGGSVRRKYVVDFVANRGNRLYYIQSAFAIPTEEKERQETASLVNINDSFRKIIVVGDYIMPKRDNHGIVTISLIDFLLRPEMLDW